MHIPALPPTGSHPSVLLGSSRKKRTVFIWTCCACSHSGMRVSVERCPSCSTPRCSYCTLAKVIVKN
ncbi:hypothetical protein EDB80DRAFT_721423 [Ilyonectria destructans]|nr:hypothetical protein EDB80DRAFT_721423 [Ilyonectria destructans]